MLQLFKRQRTNGSVKYEKSEMRRISSGTVVGACHGGVLTACNGLGLVGVGWMVVKGQEACKIG